jgi:hypothetical protein
MYSVGETRGQRLEFQRITAQQIQVQLRLAEVLPMAHIVQILNWMVWPELIPVQCPLLYVCARPKVSLR